MILLLLEYSELNFTLVLCSMLRLTLTIMLVNKMPYKKLIKQKLTKHASF